MGNQLNAPIRASQLAERLGLPWSGRDIEVTHVSPLNQATTGTLCFAKAEMNAELDVGAVVIALPGTPCGAGAVISAPQPRLAFAKTLRLLEAMPGFKGWTDEPVISRSARVSPHAYIGKGVRIGDRTIVGHFAVIADGVVIGADSHIKSCAVVGEEGFGFERDDDGTPIRLVHLGAVRIGDRVEVGSLTTVCRGTLADTVIEDDAKVDDHVHVAHNVKIRRGAMVVACAEVSGGVELGEYSWVGPNASIIQQMKIGPRALVGIGANVIRDVEAGTTVAGNPAKPIVPRS